MQHGPDGLESRQEGLLVALVGGGLVVQTGQEGGQLGGHRGGGGGHII